MKNMINGIDWVNAESMKYWSFPASYSNKKKYFEVKNAIFSNEYYGALKVDGYYQRLIKDEDGNCFMIARSKGVNGPVNKYDWVPHLHGFMKQLPNGTVLLCECYLPNNEGSSKITSLLGCLKDKCIERQNKTQKLHFYIFDVCAWNNENFINVAAEERFNKLMEYKALFNSEFVEWATYYTGEELWEKLQEYLSNGREGIVITRKDCPIYFKRTPAHLTIKVKKEIQETIDCFFTGRTSPPTKEYTGKDLENWEFWQDTKTGIKIHHNKFFEYCNGENYVPITKPFFYGWAGSLEIGVVKENMIIPIGWLSGLTEEIKANPLKYKGNCIEITCMEILYDDNNNFSGLRHAKMVQFRPDLTVEQCTWEKIFGEK